MTQYNPLEGDCYAVVPIASAAAAPADAVMVGGPCPHAIVRKASHATKKAQRNDRSHSHRPADWGVIFSAHCG